MHNPQVVIFYGSRATDLASQGDIDIICFSNIEKPSTDARRWSGIFLDAWLYPLDYLGKPEDFLRIEGGRTLLNDDDASGARLLHAVNALVIMPPTPLPDDERRHIAAWCDKMLERMARGDIEGDYRRHWLLKDIIEYYFSLRTIAVIADLKNLSLGSKRMIFWRILYLQPPINRMHRPMTSWRSCGWSSQQADCDRDEKSCFITGRLVGRARGVADSRGARSRSRYTKPATTSPSSTCSATFQCWSPH